MNVVFVMMKPFISFELFLSEPVNSLLHMWLYKKLLPQTASFSVILWVEFCSVSCDIYLLASSFFFSVWWGGRGKCFNRFFSVQFVFHVFFYQINRKKRSVIRYAQHENGKITAPWDKSEKCVFTTCAAHADEGGGEKHGENMRKQCHLERRWTCDKIKWAFYL